MNDNLDIIPADAAANDIATPDTQKDDGQGDAMASDDVEQPDAGQDDDPADHDRVPDASADAEQPDDDTDGQDGADDDQDAPAADADADHDRVPAPRKTLPRMTGRAPAPAGMRPDKDDNQGDAFVEKIPGLDEYMGDKNYESEENGQKYHNHFAPANWTKLWWEPAKLQIFRAQADKAKVKALILSFAYAAGRAIACYPESARPNRAVVRQDAIRQFVHVARYFDVLTNLRDVQITRRVNAPAIACDCNTKEMHHVRKSDVLRPQTTFGGPIQGSRV